MFIGPIADPRSSRAVPARRLARVDAGATLADFDRAAQAIAAQAFWLFENLITNDADERESLHARGELLALRAGIFFGTASGRFYRRLDRCAVNKEFMTVPGPLEFCSPSEPFVFIRVIRDQAFRVRTIEMLASD